VFQKRLEDRELAAAFEEELAAADIAGQIYKLRSTAGLSQRQLAAKVELRGPAFAQSTTPFFAQWFDFWHILAQSNHGQREGLFKNPIRTELWPRASIQILENLSF